MSVEDTRATMEAYFQVVERDGDFASFYTDDVTWRMVDSADVVQGKACVTEYVISFRSRLAAQTKPYGLSVSDRSAYLEATGVNRTQHASGLDYCLVYDVEGGKIAAIRCYGSVAALMLV